MEETPDRGLPAADMEDRPLPILASEARPIEFVRPSLPATVAAATGGFLLGVAAFVAVRVLRRPRRLRRSRVARGARRGERIDVAATRSFLVDVHLLRDR